MHISVFLMYIVYHGLCGVLDHSGIKFKIPGIYNTEDHDMHHFKFECNYAFPHPIMDILHGTFTGTFFRKSYKGKNSIQKGESTSPIK